MSYNQEHTLADIAGQGAFTSLALQRYQLNDLSQHESLKSLCQKQGINSQFLIELLNAFENPQVYDKAVFERFSVPVIVDYLRRTHRLYLGKKLPEIEQSIDHLVYGYQYYQPYLVAIKVLFNRYKQNLVTHIEVEEKEFFPHALYLHDKHYRGGCINKLYKRLDEYSVNDFIHHHDDTETELTLIREAISKYAPKQVEESLYRLLTTQINSLVHDLNIHAMIEDAVLVPKIVKMEKAAIGNQLNFRLRKQGL